MFNPPRRKRFPAIGLESLMASCALILLIAGSGYCSTTDAPAPGVPGRLSPLRWIGKRDTVTIGNAGYSLDIQRVYKVSALVPQLKSETYGQPVYAGAINMKTPTGQWITDIPASEYAISAHQNGPWLGTVVQHAVLPTWHGALTAELAVGYPSLWFEMQRTLGSGPLSASLMGYDWAKRTAPQQWSIGDGLQQTPYVRAAGRSLTVSITNTSQAVYVVYHDDAGFSGCLRFSPAPTTFRIDDTGLYWDYDEAASKADVEYLTASGTTTVSSLISFAARFPLAPESLHQTFSTDAAGKPSVTLAATGSSLILPASLASSGVSAIDTVEGALALSSSSKIKIPLPIPPQIDALTLPTTKLDPDAQKRVDDWVKMVISHQMPSGAFDFSSSRGFYDAMTCCSLAEVCRQLPANLQPQVQQTVKRGLDHLWNDSKECGVWPGYKVAPEQPFFIQTGVDYPEIMGFTLQATAIYCADVDPSYLDTRWPQITQQFDQLRTFTDWSGGAYANPGPDFYQVIPEGSIGGYLGWQALYHLAQMHHSAALAGEARARTAFAWHAFLNLYRWKPEFGNGVVNGINDGHMEVRDSSPWDQFQYTWFAFLPAFVLPHADTMHLWTRLAEMPWWEWTGSLKSKQRANDGGNVSALLRSGYVSDVLAHKDDVSTRPVWFDTFDFTPVELIPAEYWLQIYGEKYHE